MFKRKRASPLWSYFTIIDKEKCIAQCHVCEKTFSFKTTITNLKRHVIRKHPHSELIELITEEDGAAGEREQFLQVPVKDWTHLTDHEYMQKTTDTPPKKPGFTLRSTNWDLWLKKRRQAGFLRMNRFPLPFILPLTPSVVTPEKQSAPPVDAPSVNGLAETELQMLASVSSAANSNLEQNTKTEKNGVVEAEVEMGEGEVVMGEGEVVMGEGEVEMGEGEVVMGEGEVVMGEGEVEMNFLQDVTVPVHHLAEQQEENITIQKKSAATANNIAKKYFKIRRLPLQLSHRRPPQQHSTAYKMHNSDVQYITPASSASTEDDEFERFGKHVAAQLRHLPLHLSLLVQESIQSLITRERIASLEVSQDSLTESATYEEVQQ